MPEQGAKRRGDASAQLALMEQSFFLSLKERVERADAYDDLNDFERGVVRNLKRIMHFFSSVPPELIGRSEKVSSEGTVVWRRAKKESDFSIFKPYLQQQVEIKRAMADKLGYENHPYNALMDLYEEGFTVYDADRMFSLLLPASKDIFERVASEGYFSGKNDLEKRKYSKSAMIKVNQEILELLQMPRDRFRMDVSAHPFTTGLSADDVRITTRYEGVNFKATLYSTIHESGHAIYDLQMPGEYDATPVRNGASYGIHESQSRFWENFIGRSPEFTEIVIPILKKHLFFLRKYSSEDIYRYFNSVNPTMIRVDADEITYNFHIALRYEIEKKLISGEMDVSDAPEVWNDFMENYLGVRPKSYSEGILQDVHWSDGSFGYFPTYSLGNIVAAMFWDSGDFRTLVKERRFSDIKNILYEKLHKYGSIYSPKEVLRKSLGEEYNTDHLISYLKKKYIQHD